MLGLTGCQVIVLGDSNSCMSLTHQCPPEMWPGVLQGLLDDARSLWVVENVSKQGMAAATVRGPDGEEQLQPGWDEPIGAAFHLERALNELHLAALCRLIPFEAMAPRLVIALGTNDVAVHLAWQVVENIMALVKRVEEVAPCVRVYVATIPPRFDVEFEKRKANVHRLLANGMLRGRVRPDRLLEFDTGFTREDLNPDGVHLNVKGHAKRAEVALRLLFPGLAR